MPASEAACASFEASASAGGAFCETLPMPRISAHATVVANAMTATNELRRIRDTPQYSSAADPTARIGEMRLEIGARKLLRVEREEERKGRRDHAPVLTNRACILRERCRCWTISRIVPNDVMHGGARRRTLRNVAIRCIVNGNGAARACVLWRPYQNPRTPNDVSETVGARVAAGEVRDRTPGFRRTKAAPPASMTPPPIAKYVARLAWDRA